MTNNIPQNKLRFSFICNNSHAYAMTHIQKHGMAWITEEQYNQVMDIIYGKKEA